MAVPFTFMQGLKFDVGWAHKFDVCSYRFLSKPAETKFSSADHTELSQLSVSQRSSGFMQGLADGNDFRGCRALHTSSRRISFGSEAGFGHTAAQAEAYLSRCYCS